MRHLFIVKCICLGIISSKMFWKNKSASQIVSEIICFSAFLKKSLFYIKKKVRKKKNIQLAVTKMPTYIGNRYGGIYSILDPATALFAAKEPWMMGWMIPAPSRTYRTLGYAVLFRVLYVQLKNRYVFIPFVWVVELCPLRLLRPWRLPGLESLPLCSPLALSLQNSPPQTHFPVACFAV